MGTETVAASTDGETANAVGRLAEDRDITNSKAADQALRVGLSRLGYGAGGRTPAQETAEFVATGLWFVATTLIVLSALGSVALMYAGVTVLFGSLGVFASARVVIPRVEPGLTNRLPKIEVTRYGE
jgi:hypothetical protein